MYKRFVGENPTEAALKDFLHKCAVAELKEQIQKNYNRNPTAQEEEVYHRVVNTIVYQNRESFLKRMREEEAKRIRDEEAAF